MIIDYLMTRDYCKNWSVSDAIREFAQNAIDSKNYEFNLNERTITNNANIPLSCFALGNSTKGEHDLGQFGEGFKIALLVLTAKGIKYSLITNQTQVIGTFRYNEDLGIETFCLTFTKDFNYPENMTQFSCDYDDVEELKNKITFFSDKPLKSRPQFAEIIKDKPGKFYVGGLLVAESDKYSYGYNFNPSNVRLNRDRKTVDNIDSLLGQYWGKYGHISQLFNLLITDAKDVSYTPWWLSSEKKKQLAAKFVMAYGHLPVSEAGYQYSGSSAIVLNSTAFNAFKESGITTQAPAPKENHPVTVIRKFLESHDLMNTESGIKLLTQSKGWNN